MKTPLDDVYDVARRIIAEGVGRGESWERIAEELSEVVGKKVTVPMVKYFYYREFGQAGESVASGLDDGVTDGEFDLVSELRWLYSIQKRRIKQLVKLESEAGLPMPETSRNIEIAGKLLEKLADIMSEFGGSDLEDFLSKLLEVVDGGGASASEAD